MIAGRHARGANAPASGVRAVLPPGAQVRELGALSVGWGPSVQAAEDQELLVLLDGFLLAPSGGAERLAGAWRRQGALCLHKLRGAFTLLVWDHERQAGVLACDQFSMRGCVFHDGGTRHLSFSTSLATLRRLLPVTPPPAPEVLVSSIVPENPQGHRTMLSGVERVGAACFLELGRTGWRRCCYWKPTWSGTLEASREEQATLLAAELDRAVALRLDPSRPTGVVLSGGLDSTLVVAAASAATDTRDLRAYSMLFPDWPAADESARIQATWAHYGLTGTRCTVAPEGALRITLEALRDSGTLPGGPGALIERPLLESAAKQGVQVVLDGQGGDELFGLSPYVLADRLRRGRLFDLARLVHRVCDTRKSYGRAHARTLLVDYALAPALPASLARRRAARNTSVLAPLTPAALAVFNASHDSMPWLERSGTPLWWSYQRHRLTEAREETGLAEYTWQRGESFGLRSPAPLLDVDLVELALRLPPETGWERVDRPLVRAAMGPRLPEVVRSNRRKANIGPFYLDVMTGRDGSVIGELLLDPGARVREWVDPAGLERLVRRRPTLQERDALGWATVVWRLATAECWLRWLEDSDFPERQLQRSDLPQVSGAAID